MAGDVTAQAQLFTPPPSARLTLRDRFLVPPFSVLDSRAGYWQDRRRDWIGLGIKSELGRDETLLGGYAQIGSDTACPTCDGVGHAHNAAYALADGYVPERCRACNGTGKQYGRSQHGTSVFDPVVCELFYRWFTPEAGFVFDPFAGGSVRGITAAHLGRRYVGIDLRDEQVASNTDQAATIGASYDWSTHPTWVTGDSRDIPALVSPDNAPPFFDAVFSCPPYYDLEQYSDDPRDLSNAGDYAVFRDVYEDIIRYSVARLRPDRFACFVVSDIRDAAGRYVGLVPDTIRAFEAAGAHLYNEAILINSLGSAPVRVSAQFGGGRKLGKTHQNMLIFLKGDAKRAVAACGEIAEVAVEQGGATWRTDGSVTYGSEVVT